VPGRSEAAFGCTFARSRFVMWVWRNPCTGMICETPARLATRATQAAPLLCASARLRMNRPCWTKTLREAQQELDAVYTSFRALVRLKMCVRWGLM
jgi:hypothetical protein